MNRSTYRHQQTRRPSNREVRRILLADTITELHLASRSTYGVRRIRAALLLERGLLVNRKLIRRIMVQQGLHGLPMRKRRRHNLLNVATSEDLVNRNFNASSMNSLWLTDVTEHKTREGNLYCCVVLDQFSRRVVGWAIDRRNEATLVNDALIMAASSRATSSSTIIHSDHGSQFTSWSFTRNVKHHELLGSMGTIGDCFDNAPMESFWGTMQIELLNRKKTWMTYVELATAMADYIVNFYNPLRR
ncbi:MAG TPA: IS3 family transposase, partial [Acidimicrobiales bacterium]|nr:IS3 family transposase [Acidimicrobiales bacterium]